MGRLKIQRTPTIRRMHSGEEVDCTGCSRLEKRETEDGWRVTAEFPLELFHRDRQILFGLELLEYVGGEERNLTWPSGPFQDELRLNLGYFTPDRTALLSLI